MAVKLAKGGTVALPSEKEAVVARESRRKLAQHLKRRQSLRVRLLGGKDEGENVELPAPAARLLLDVLEQMANGNAVTLIPVHAELSTQQAAEILNVSRPFVIKEIESGRLPHRKVGSHRRVAFEDLMKYAQEMRAKQGQALQRLADNAAELGLDY